MSEFADLLDITFNNKGGWARVECRLNPDKLELAAAILASSIARQRIGVNERLHQQWKARQLNSLSEPVTEGDLQILKAGLLQDLGAPDSPSPDEHLHGLVAEIIWYEVVSDLPAGPGRPIRVEAHDWSATDPGGDGLTVYLQSDGGYCFRLWESKHHGTATSVRKTVNRACRQIKSRSLSYLTRFSLIAHDMTDDEDLARFYGSLAELWVDRDAAAGVGVSIGASSDADTKKCFGKVTSYFDLEPAQHQAHLHLMGDFAELARLVRSQVWKGCGIWTGP